MDEIKELTQGEIDQFNNQSPASQNVRLGTKLEEIIEVLNFLLTDDTKGK